MSKQSLLLLSVLVALLFSSSALSQDQADDPRWNIQTAIQLKADGSAPTAQPNPAFRENTLSRVIPTPYEVLVVEPNVRPRPNTTYHQSEVNIATNPVNRNIMFGASHNIRSSTINVATFITTNGGQTWYGRDTLADFNTQRGDPAPIIDKNGYFIYGHLNSSTNFGSVTGMGMNRSTNLGISFEPTIPITNAGGSDADKNAVGTDDAPASPFYGNTYMAWTKFTAGNTPAVILVTRTTDAGASWTAAQQVNTAGSGTFSQGTDVQAGPNGHAYICWVEESATSPFPSTSVGFAKSTDGGVSWTFTNSAYATTGMRSSSYNSWAVRVNDFPRMAVDKSGGSRNGWIYIVAAEQNRAPAGSEADVVLHRSTDGGTTWSAGIRVNQDALNNGKKQFFPSICVDPGGGINVAYYDNRDWPSVGDSCDIYMSRSLDGGNTWTDVKVSDHSFKPKNVPGVNSMGDYMGITAGSGKVWPMWMDDRSGFYDVWTSGIQTTEDFGWVKGTITSVSGGAAVAGVNVDFVQTVPQAPGLSNGSGLYVTGAKVDTPGTTANLTLRARKFGYVDTTVAVTVTRNDTLTRNFQIRPAPGGTLSVYSHTATTNLRSYVEVKFGSLVVVSDSTNGTTGLLSAPLPTGTYSVRVDAVSPYATRTFPSVVINAGGTTNVDALTQAAVQHNPAALRDTLAVSQNHGKTLQLTNTTADSVPWRLSADEALAITNTPADLKAIARSHEQQPSYGLPKGEVDPRSEPAGLDGRGGPDAFGYVWIDSDEPGGPVYNWVEIKGIGTQITTWTGSADDGYATVALPFSFPYYGNNYSSMNVVTNGFAEFAATSTTFTNTAIPTTAVPNNAIYPFWDDLNVGQTPAGTVWYYNDAANQRFIVQWDTVSHYLPGTTPGRYTFQLILKPSGEMLVQYRKMEGTLNSATIGIENSTGTVGLQVVFNGNYVHDNMALLFKLRGLSWLNFTPTTGILPPSATQNITATFDATGLTAGTTYNGNTFLDVTHPDVQGTITIPSSLRVQSALGKVVAVTPASVTFPATPIGNVNRDSVRVRSIGDQTVTISSVTTTNPRYVATATSTVIPAGDSARIRIVYTPTLPAGTDTGRVIILSDATTPRVDVMLTGTALAVAGIIASPDSFYFSLPQIPDTTRATLKIKNPGTDTLRYNINEATDAFSFASGDRPVQTTTYEPLDLPKEAIDPRPGIGGTDGQGGPDAFGYRWIDSDEPGGPAFSWIDISGSAPFLDSTSAWIPTGTNRPGDEGYFPVLLPSSFSFYGVSKDTLFIGTNGNVMFQRPTGDVFTNAAFPTPGGNIDNHIGIFWDDLETRAGARIYYGMSGGSFVVQYQGMARFNGTVPNYTFEIILSPGGLIKTQYLAMAINGGIVNSASIGIENSTGSIGLQTVFNAAYVHNNLAIIYTSDLLPWLSTDRTSGTIAPGDSQNVQVKVVPNQAAGGYTGHLRITGNTPTVKSVGVRLDITGAPGSGWVANTSGVTSTLYAVKAVSLNIGWAAGASGVVRRTTDGGTTWTSVGGGAIGTNAIYAIEALDANTAFVTTSPAATFIYKTTNGGTTWTQVYTDATAGAFIDGIKMYDANNGIAMGDPVGGKWVILRTTDGGNNWARIATEPNQVGTEAGSNHALWTIGTTHIWYPGNGTASTVYRSTDGGATWTFSTLPFTAAFTQAIAFINTQVGFVASSGGLAARTTDGGVIWTSVTFPGTGSLYGAAVNGTDFFATRGTTIYRSTDLGVTWTSSYVGSGTFEDINFASQGGYGRGWAVSSNGTIAAGYFATVGVEENLHQETPLAFALMQNYPNPFNPTTTIRYALSEAAFVTLRVYNILGQEVVQLRDEMQNAGSHDVVWDGRSKAGVQVASGIYFYRIEAKPVSGSVFTSLKKMILLK